MNTVVVQGSKHCKSVEKCILIPVPLHVIQHVYTGLALRLSSTHEANTRVFEKEARRHTFDENRVALLTRYTCLHGLIAQQVAPWCRHTEARPDHRHGRSQKDQRQSKTPACTIGPEKKIAQPFHSRGWRVSRGTLCSSRRWRCPSPASTDRMGGGDCTCWGGGTGGAGRSRVVLPMDLEAPRAAAARGGGGRHPRMKN